ncbi:MAG: transglycosylase SLT domain-containing protein [Burkholderiaceae bacterium]
MAATILPAALLTGVLCLILPASGQTQAKRPAPQRIAPPPVSTPDEALVAAREAFARNDAARFQSVAPQAREHPLLADYVDFWALRMRLRQPAAGDAWNLNGSADADIRRFIARAPDSLVADLLRRDWLLNLGKRGQWSTFDREYANWILRDDDDVHCYASLSRLLSGAAPLPDARATLFRQRNFGEGCRALLDGMTRSGALPRTDVFALLLNNLEYDSTENVRRTADLLGLDPAAVSTALRTPIKALSMGWGREIALIALARLARSDPAEAVERVRAGVATLREPDIAFLWSQIAAAGMRRLAPEAAQWARLGLGAAPSDETLVWMARAALRAHDWPLLRQIIEKMSKAGSQDPAWAYWQARALRETGEPTRADVLLRSIAGQFHFYGQLAAEDLGQLTAPPPRAARPTDAEMAESARNPGFVRALKFYELGLRLEGNREWNFQLRGMNDRQLLSAAEWACQRRVLDRCVNTADRTQSEHDFALRFVSPFIDELKPVAAERGLDPAWIYGLIRQESRFIMDARSWAGAQGLMQIMPNTARWIARRLGEKEFRLEQLNELPTNLRFGTYYLKSVLDDLEGSPVLASAAYNAGPGRPRNWRATLTQPVEGAIFAEIIPFAETRDYVKKVLSNAVFYAALFSGEPQSLKQRLGRIAPQPAGKTELP